MCRAAADAPRYRTRQDNSDVRLSMLSQRLYTTTGGGKSMNLSVARPLDLCGVKYVPS